MHWSLRRGLSLRDKPTSVFLLLICRFGRPTGEKNLLKPGELAKLFGPDQGFHILRDNSTLINDGRELSMFVAQKRQTKLS